MNYSTLFSLCQYRTKNFISDEEIVSNPDMFIEKINAYGYTDANGKPITVTKEQLMEGIDVKDLKGSIPKALETNETLRNIVMMSAAGEIFMNVSKFQESVLRGEKFAGDADIENLLKQGKPEEIQAMQNLLGIGELHNVNPDAFNRKISELEASGKLDELYNKYKAKTASTGAINAGENANIGAESGNINAESGNIVTESANINAESANLNDKSANLGAEAQNISQNVAKPLDNDSEVRYALNKAKYISYSKIGKSQVENVRSKLKQLYSDIDSGVATEIAIEDGNTVYIVDSGKENGKINFGFRKKLVISDESLRKDFIRRRNNDSVSKGHISDGLSSKFRDEYDNGRRGDRRLETGEKLSADKGQSQNNEGRVSSDNGNRGVQVLTSDKKALPNEKKASSETENTQKKAGGESGKSMTVIESAAFAKENVPEYSQLNADDQARIRRLIRQAKANGFTDAQTRAYARVSARSGIDIVIDKESLYLGNGKYADGLYSHKQNKIFINPEGSRSPARLLIHELTHALYNDRQSRVILDRGAKNLTKEQKEAIWNKYFPDAEFDENNIIFKDELSSHYTEALLDDDALLEKLCNDNPTLKDKILSFFKKAITGYSDEPNLSREAKKLYKRYKTLFDSFSERNQYNAVTSINNENMHDTEDGERFAFGVTQQEIDEYIENAYEKKNTEDYKKYAKASETLIEEVADEINISGYSHALRDNDIRHIRNSHGENTKEKYPVTKKDLSKIPDIVANYDKVFVFRKNATQVGLMYVKVSSEGLVYYLEQITTKYGNEKLLVNKQMIKTGIEDIPDISGLKDAITKKESEIEFLADLKARQVYAQSVYQTHSDKSIHEKLEKSNPSDKKLQKIFRQILESVRRCLMILTILMFQGIMKYQSQVANIKEYNQRR